MTDRVLLEFTVEPFTPNAPGPHVLASIAAAAATVGATVDMGPFGTSTAGEASDIADAARALIVAALTNGATRVSLQVTTEDPTEETT